jgi:iduronate 2-sulfatase
MESRLLRGDPLHRRASQPVIGRAIRTERYRFVEWKEPGAPPDTADLENYDCETDPIETLNLAAAEPDKLKELRAIAAQHPEAKPSR